MQGRNERGHGVRGRTPEVELDRYLACLRHRPRGTGGQFDDGALVVSTPTSNRRRCLKEAKSFQPTLSFEIKVDYSVE